MGECHYNPPWQYGFPTVAVDDFCSKFSSIATGQKGTKSAEEEFSAAFNGFWEQYPARRRNKKQESWKEWKKQGCEPITTKILNALVEQCRSSDWREDDGKYIPGALGYLQQRRWEDGTAKGSDDSHDQYEV